MMHEGREFFIGEIHDLPNRRTRLGKNDIFLGWCVVGDGTAWFDVYLTYEGLKYRVYFNGALKAVEEADGPAPQYNGEAPVMVRS